MTVLFSNHYSTLLVTCPVTSVKCQMGNSISPYTCY